VLVNRFDLKSAAVLMDRVQAQSVMLNLIDNAVKFTPAGGKIEIDGRLVEDQAEPRYVELIVSDTGVGIPPPQQHRLFRRFARVHPNNAGEPAGAGLGLAVAQQLATHQGGWLTLKQRPGWSTTFSFGLPLATTDSPFGHSTETLRPN
jgi:signal transduction histidine kinase